VLGIRVLTSLKKAAILELNPRKIYKTTTPNSSILVHFNHKRKFLMQAFFPMNHEAVPAPFGKIVAQAVNIPVIGIDGEKPVKTESKKAYEEK